MTLAGMDVAEVRQLAGELRRAAAQLHSLVSTLDGRVSSTGWTGRDADTFKHEWWPQHRQAVLHAADTIQGLGQSASNNADDQERASSPNGGSASVWAAGAGAAVAGAAGVAANHSATTTPAASSGGSSTVPEGPGNFSNAAIADYLLNPARLGHNLGDVHGECRQAVDDAVAAASGGSMQLGAVTDSEKADYQAGFERLGAVPIDPSQAVKGDIVQVGSPGSPHLHTYVIVKNLGNGNFDVVDSNSDWKHTVYEHPRAFDYDGSGAISKIWRLGKV